MQIRLLLLSCCCIIYFGSVAQKVSIEKELYFIDTIKIKDPILVRFMEHGVINYVLVSKERLDHMRNDDTSYVNFLCSGSGYLFFYPIEFSCLVNNLLSYHPSLGRTRFYSKLQKHLLDDENDPNPVLVPIDGGKYDKLKEHNGWEYREIYPRKFLLFLAKGSTVYGCQGKDEIRIKNMDNVYFKTLVPVTW
jgi:hypothetical protein